MTSRLTIVCWSLFISTLLAYWYALSCFILNAPEADDFVDILWFFEIFKTAEGWEEKLASLFLPIHQHITLVNHILFVFDHAIFGEANFSHYVLIGHVIAICICTIFVYWFSRSVGYAAGFAIVFSCYLNLFYWHSSFWAMTAISNHAVILFAALAACSFQKNPDNLLAPLLWGLAATASQANGFAVFIAFGIALIVHLRVQKKTIPWKQVTPFIVAFFVLLGAYVCYQNPFDTFHHLDHQAIITEPHLIHLYQRDVSGASAHYHPSFAKLILSFFTVAGATVFNTSQYIFSLTLGVSLVFLWGYILLKKTALVDRFSWIMLIFVILSIALIAAGRGFASGPLYVMNSHYRMYSFLLVLLTLQVLLKNFSGKPMLLRGALLCGLIIQIASITVLDDIRKNRHMLESSLYYWLIDGGFGRTTLPIYPPNQDKRLMAALKMNTYDPYSAIPARHKPSAVIRLDSAAASCLQTTQNHPGATDAHISAYSKKARATTTEFTVQMNNNPWQFDAPSQLLFCQHPTSYQVNLDSKNYSTTPQKFWPVLIPKKQLPPGDYWVVAKQNNQSYPLGSVTFK